MSSIHLASHDVIIKPDEAYPHAFENLNHLVEKSLKTESFIYSLFLHVMSSQLTHASTIQAKSEKPTNQ